MNWGNRLLVVFIVFGALIGYLVFRCIGSSVDLVSKDYYKEELAYQTIIDGKKNASFLSVPVHISQSAGGVIICLPPEMKGDIVTGSILLYCASSSAKDRKIKMQTDRGGCQNIPVPEMGSYTLKLRWKQNRTQYFHEQALIIQ